MREEPVKVPEPQVAQTQPQASDKASTCGTRRQRRNPNTTLSRHATKCRVCNHPLRHAIEFEFLNWRNPADLARSYGLRDLTTIYRHAHATGLFAKRRLNLRFAMERIVERVNEVPVTATSVIRAARAIARINDSGEWVDPPSRVIVTHVHAEEVGDPAPHRPYGSKRNRGQQGVSPSIATAFEPVLLDEPSESAANSAELPKINGKPAPPEIILELTPEFARCREERRLAIEADRQARAARDSVPEPPKPAQAKPDAPQAPAVPQIPHPPADSLPPSMLARMTNVRRVGANWEGVLIANETHSPGESND